MESKSKKLISILSMTGALIVVLILINGCKKSEPSSAETSSNTMQGMQEHATMTTEEAAKAAAAVEQTICPVMGNPIDKNVFVEYQGKKVYFCCPECKAKFNADPEKYVAKLPQFKQ